MLHICEQLKDRQEGVARVIRESKKLLFILSEVCKYLLFVNVSS